VVNGLQFSHGILNAGQHFNSQSMNLTYFLGKVILCGVMKIDRFDDRNLEIIYSGIDKHAGLIKGELWLYRNNRNTLESVYICWTPVTSINHIRHTRGHTGRMFFNYSPSIAVLTSFEWKQMHSMLHKSIMRGLIMYIFKLTILEHQIEMLKCMKCFTYLDADTSHKINAEYTSIGI